MRPEFVDKGITAYLWKYFKIKITNLLIFKE